METASPLDLEGLDRYGRVAESPRERTTGLLNRDRMEHGEGLLIPGGPVNGMAIHTVGMSFSIDVLFLDRENYVRLVAWNMGPGRQFMCPGAAAALELPAGIADQTQVGDQISFG